MARNYAPCQEIKNYYYCSTKSKVKVDKGAKILLHLKEGVASITNPHKSCKLAFMVLLYSNIHGHPMSFYVKQS